MIDVNTALLEEFRHDVENMQDGLDQFERRHSRHSMDRAIEEAVDNELQNPILHRAQQMASPHVGEGRAQTIQPVEGSWAGDAYVAGLGSQNEVVMSHASGTGSHSTAGPYKIEPDKGEKLAFESNGRSVVVDYVVHPGVRGKGFMQKAISRNMDDMLDRVLSDVVDQADDALSPE